MSRRVKSLDEISESRILFDKNPPAFGYILVTVVAAFLIVAVVWSIKTPKVNTIPPHTANSGHDHTRTFAGISRSICFHIRYGQNA